MPESLPPILPESEGQPSIVLPPQFKGGNPAVVFRHPRGNWRVRVGTYALKPYDLCHPSQTYTAEVNMLCGSAVYELQEGSPLFSMTAVEFARRVQILGSIQHVTRRACLTCRTAYREALTPDEKKWLYATQPSVGSILGLENGQALADLADNRPYRMPPLASRLSDASGKV